MRNFNNLNDLSKYIGSPAGQQTVMGKKNIKNALREAAILLEKIMYEQLQDYYASYTTVIYERTYGLLNSLRISPIKQVGNELQIMVYFDNESATHPSILGGDPGYTADIINDGWAWKDQSVDIYRFSRYDGFHFVEKSIDIFNTRNKWGFKISKSREN
ncbi:hypothetical protein [Paenibacillus tianjinensis]|uniref:DUF5348 domain-containing protein n=1 Tax=Paenibacillus tianjinensis TaxID=2810347 RepID=A0ABX7L6C5_9BACL|nr:hypothetical protein [Paenibacillus tianjinensis]QSF43266.1 hypothetical protein JRJ22_18540 [Paenibacillus tianjinensis]